VHATDFNLLFQLTIAHDQGNIALQLSYTMRYFDTFLGDRHGNPRLDGRQASRLQAQFEIPVLRDFFGVCEALFLGRHPPIFAAQIRRALPVAAVLAGKGPRRAARVWADVQARGRYVPCRIPSPHGGTATSAIR
jgi:hypothetical protein